MFPVSMVCPTSPTMPRGGHGSRIPERALRRASASSIRNRRAKDSTRKETTFAAWYRSLREFLLQTFTSPARAQPTLLIRQVSN